METKGTKQARRAFNRMTGTRRSMPPGTHSKGKTGIKDGNNGLGHRAPATTNGQGVRRASQATKKNGAGFPTGHRAPSTTLGQGTRKKSQKTGQRS